MPLATQTSPTKLSKVRRFAVITFNVTMVIVFGMIVALFCGAFSRGSGSHAASVSWLPESASDISYRENSSMLFYGFTYECAMSLEDFQAFARQSGWKPVEKRDFYGSINRKLLKLPPFRTEKLMPPDRYKLALVYENIAINGGGIRVIYDPERQRLLVDESTH
jgi:hypothetical protein